MKQKIVVGISGGVDSSVAALLLSEQGYDVECIFMKNWENQDDEICTSADDYNDALQVCNVLGLPVHSVNFSKEYWNKVFSYFLSEYKAGRTPNPDVLCNREIKFKAFLNYALKLGVKKIATGHYAKIEYKNSEYKLLKGKDKNKDQSYFLYMLSHDPLSKSEFPLGDLNKEDVRKIAKKAGLPTAEKKDSTGICFIGERNFRQFLGRYIGAQPGHFETLDGQVVGQHPGAAFFTLGQRKGMGIGGPGEPWFVVGKDISRHVVYVAQGKNHPALFCDELTASSLSWVTNAPSQFPFDCESKVRYRQISSSCQIISLENETVKVRFKEPQRAVTPGQSIVFYKDKLCLGGGVIMEAGPSYYQQNKALKSVDGINHLS